MLTGLSTSWLNIGERLFRDIPDTASDATASLTGSEPDRPTVFSASRRLGPGRRAHRSPSPALGARFVGLPLLRYRRTGEGLNLLYPTRRHLPMAVAAFIAFVVDKLSDVAKLPEAFRA